LIDSITSRTKNLAIQLLTVACRQRFGHTKSKSPLAITESFRPKEQGRLPVILAALRAGRMYTRKMEKDRYGSFSLARGTGEDPIAIHRVGRLLPWYRDDGIRSVA
jgi:hypothetical protein